MSPPARWWLLRDRSRQAGARPRWVMLGALNGSGAKLSEQRGIPGVSNTTASGHIRRAVTCSYDIRLRYVQEQLTTDH
jgi:hypothetical protein